MKAVLISIHPKWIEKICHKIGELNGKPIYKKRIEVRKGNPKERLPIKCFIYETYDKKYDGIGVCWEQGNIFEHACKKVIGEFVCDRIDRIGKRGINNNFDYCYLSINEWGNDDIEIEITDIQKSCISKSELNAYGANSSCLYAWHITDLKIYDKPKELSEFKAYEKVKCPAYINGHCVDRNQNQVTLCGNLDCEYKKIARPPQSYMFVEELQE
jgi:predicted transcriptional regulator